MLGLVGDGLTLAKNFAPWFGGVALAAALAGAGVAWWLAGLYHAERVHTAQRAQERAETTLAAYKAEMRTAVAAGEAAGAQRVAEAVQAERDRNSRTNARIDAIPAQVARLLAPDLATLGSALNDPRFRCLDLPLPLDALRVLERPGGRAGAADGDRGPDPR